MLQMILEDIAREQCHDANVCTVEEN